MRLPVPLGELLAARDLSEFSLEEQERARELIVKLDAGTATAEDDAEAWKFILRSRKRGAPPPP